MIYARVRAARTSGTEFVCELGLIKIEVQYLSDKCWMIENGFMLVLLLRSMGVVIRVQ